MPVIQISMLEGRTVEQKRELVEKVTDVVVDTIKTNRSAVTIVIHEMKKENWATAGQLKSDETAK